jgi:Ca-activated chloride channel family protein
MNNNFDESKLTAYILGELSEDENREMEVLIEGSPELQDEIAKIRETVSFLEKELAEDSISFLSDHQRQAILEKSSGYSRRFFHSWYFRVAGVAAAATFLFLAVHNWTEPVISPVQPEMIGLNEPAPQEESIAEDVQSDSEIQEGLDQTAADRMSLDSNQSNAAAAPDKKASNPDVQLLESEQKSQKNEVKEEVRRIAQELSRPAQKAASQQRNTPQENDFASEVALTEETARPSATAAVAVRNGKIEGTVRDSTGGLIPGAEVLLAALQTGFKQIAFTDSQGAFSFSVEPGKYSLMVNMLGFREFRTSVEVQSEKTIALVAELEVGSTTETVIMADTARAKGIRQELDFSRPTAIIASVNNYMSEQAVGGVVGGVTAAAGRQGGVPVIIPRSYPPMDVPREGDIRVKDGEFNTEAYDRIVENPFIPVSQDPLSTFSIDVDTASYSNMRRFLNERQFPPIDSIRIEELINYFRYGYEGPKDDRPFAVHLETAPAPWKPEHQLVRIGLKGKTIPSGERKPSNLVFLLDVSGSMQPENKLPLLKRAFRLLVDNLTENDRVAIVVYAGASGLVLPSTPCSEKEKVLEALEELSAGGSTNGGQGIQLAYKTAEENLIKGGINRVILATDGDFNVGVTNQGDLTRLIEEKAKSGVFLTVLGFGMGNYKDSNLEKLADKGNGNYAYIDTLNEARKVLVEEIGSTLVTIAKDVKIQIEFNPAQVNAYRLIGYENRILRHQDFNDDTKDAGEIGAGHTVTALYEIVPAGVEIDVPSVDPLKYQTGAKPASGTSDEIMTVKLRYKEPDGEVSQLIDFALKGYGQSFEKASVDFRFAAAVASFGMLMRDSEFAGQSTFEEVLRIAQNSLAEDSGKYRTEFINLVKKARAIKDLDSLEQ